MSGDTRSWLEKTGIYADRPAPAAAAKPAPSVPVLVTDEADVYRPWGQLHADSSLIEFRLAPDELGHDRGELLPLRLMLRVSCEHGPLGDHVSFTFPHLIVTLAGHHLRELRTDVLNGKVGYVEEYDPARWGEAPAGRPVIRKIEVIQAS